MLRLLLYTVNTFFFLLLLLLLLLLEILGEAVIRIRIIIIRINQIIQRSNHYSSRGSLLIRQLLHGFTRYLAWRSG